MNNFRRKKSEFKILINLKFLTGKLTCAVVSTWRRRQRRGGRGDAAAAAVATAVAAVDEAVEVDGGGAGGGDQDVALPEAHNRGTGKECFRAKKSSTIWSPSGQTCQKVQKKQEIIMEYLKIPTK